MLEKKKNKTLCLRSVSRPIRNYFQEMPTFCTYASLKTPTRDRQLTKVFSSQNFLNVVKESGSPLSLERLAPGGGGLLALVEWLALVGLLSEVTLQISDWMEMD